MTKVKPLNCMTMNQKEELLEEVCLIHLMLMSNVFRQEKKLNINNNIIMYSWDINAIISTFLDLI